MPESNSSAIGSAKNKQIETESLSDFVKKKIKERKISQLNLAVDGGLSAATISRICRNNNDKGSKYTLSEDDFYSLIVGLRLSHEEIIKLAEIAFPRFWIIWYNSSEKLDDINKIIEKNGHLPLGRKLKKD